MVLVINDNPYGLMFALRYPYRYCPWEAFGVHVLDSRSFHDDHCYFQGFLSRTVMYRVVHIASMFCRKGLGDLSRLSSRHHHMNKEEKIQG